MEAGRKKERVQQNKGGKMRFRDKEADLFWIYEMGSNEGSRK